MNKETLKEAFERSTTSFFDHYCGTGHVLFNKDLGKMLGIDEDCVDAIIVGVIKGLAEAQILSGQFSYYGSPIKMMEGMVPTKLKFQPESVGGCVISTPINMLIGDKIPENVPIIPMTMQEGEK